MRVEIITVEIDFTKNVFGLHGVDETAEPVLVGPEVSDLDATVGFRC